MSPPTDVWEFPSSVPLDEEECSQRVHVVNFVGHCKTTLQIGGTKQFAHTIHIKAPLFSSLNSILCFCTLIFVRVLYMK